MKISLELQPCCGQISGIGTYTLELAKQLHSTEEMSFYGTIFNYRNRQENPWIKEIPFPVFSNHLLPYGAYRRAWHFLPFSYQAFFPEDQSDVYHFFNYIVPPRISGKVITTIHDSSFLLFPETLAKRNLERIRKDIDYSIQRSDRIIAVSENGKQELMQLLGIDEKKIRVVYNAASPVSSNQTLAEIQKKFHFEHPYILYVGNLEPRKNIPSLIQAYRKLKIEKKLPFHLVIAGQKGWRYESIFETVQKLSLENEITFTGYVSDEDKAALYKNASLFVFPSLYEGFGIPIIEAMSAGVPVVCSNTSSMPEVAGEAALLVSPENIEEIAEAMERLLTDFSLRKEKIRLGTLQASKFSWASSAKKLIEVYEELKNS